MSRSYRRHPITGHTQALSDRPGKRLASRRFRNAVHRALRAGSWQVLPHPREFGSPWSFPKDGKTWAGNEPEAFLRLILRK